jgi:hypothetical protein
MTCQSGKTLVTTKPKPFVTDTAHRRPTQARLARWPDHVRTSWHRYRRRDRTIRLFSIVAVATVANPQTGLPLPAGYRRAATPMAAAKTEDGSTSRYRDPEERRAYQRDLMRKRYAEGKMTRACREHARCCAELAALAATPEEREHLLSLRNPKQS